MTQIPSLASQAVRLAEAIPVARLHPKVVAWAATIEATNNPWALAFSGGSDSVALLLLIWAHWPRQRLRLTALHFNHALRGAASEADEAFCRNVCAELGLMFRSDRWPDAKPNVSEAEARTARHAFFDREMTQLSARVLWTGHQKNDIAETQLMRLARGSGTAGLSAPRPYRADNAGRVWLRPLLTLTKDEINQALTAAGIGWREDASNASSVYLRNRIRHQVTPAWQAAAERDVLEGAALSRERLEEDDAALESWLDAQPIAMNETMIDLRALQGKPRALWRRALHRWTPTAQLERNGFDELLLLCERGAGRMSMGRAFAVVEGGTVTLQPVAPAAHAWSAATLREGAILVLVDGAQIQLTQKTYGADERTKVMSGQVNPAREAHLSLFDTEFTIRPWLPGDRYRPLGAPGTAKLQDLFINRRIHPLARNALPVVCTKSGEIVWVPGFSPAESAKITDKTVTGVQLTYEPGTSTVPV